MKHSYSTISCGRLFVTAIALLAALVSCQKPQKPDDAVEEPTEKEFVFVIGDAPQTRLTGVTYAAESNVSRWALYLFDSNGNRYGNPVQVSGNGQTVLTLPIGNTYTVCAVVNYPNSFSVTNVSTLSGLESTASNLGDNALSNFVMYGSCSLSVSVNTPPSVSIPVSRLVAKTGIQNITVNMTDDFYANETFTLKGIYVTNAYTRSTFGADPTPAGTRSLWYNTMGWHGTGSASTSTALDNLTGHVGMNRTIANGTTFQAAEYFYFYPNKTSDDTTSSLWSVRHTRLVIEASIGATTYYYVVTLPVSVRNNTYIATAVNITQPGALDPEQPTPYAMSVVFSTSTDDWAGPVNVEELS